MTDDFLSWCCALRQCHTMVHVQQLASSSLCESRILPILGYLGKVPYMPFLYFMCKGWTKLLIKPMGNIYMKVSCKRKSGRIVNKKIWCESEAYRNFGKRFDWSLAIKRHIVMAAPIVEMIWLVNGFKRHIVMAALFPVTAPSSVQNLMKIRW